LFVEHSDGHDPISNNREDAAIAHALLRCYGFERLMELLLRFLKGSAVEDRNMDNEPSLHTFQEAIKTLLVEERESACCGLTSTLPTLIALTPTPAGRGPVPQGKSSLLVTR
jgi:hypothetical protein